PGRGASAAGRDSDSLAGAVSAGRACSEPGRGPGRLGAGRSAAGRSCWGAGRSCWGAGRGPGVGAPGLADEPEVDGRAGLPDAPSLPPSPFDAEVAAGGGFSRILRTTGGSMVDDADLTNSPCAFR